MKKMNSIEKTLSILSKAADGLSDRFAGLIIADEREKIVTLDMCLNIIKKEYTEHPKIKFFVLSVDENSEPGTENKDLIVTISFLDAKRKSFFVDGTLDEYKIHTSEIDKKLKAFLKNRDSVTAQLNFT